MYHVNIGLLHTIEPELSVHSERAEQRMICCSLPLSLACVQQRDVMEMEAVRMVLLDDGSVVSAPSSSYSSGLTSTAAVRTSSAGLSL